MKYYITFYSLVHWPDGSMRYVDGLESDNVPLDASMSILSMRDEAHRHARILSYDGWRIARIATRFNTLFYLTPAVVATQKEPRTHAVPSPPV